MNSRRFSFLALAAVLLPGVALAGDGIPNWSAPSTWSPPRASHGVTTLGDVSSPLPFIAVTPCRVADTRGNGFTGAYGPPALVANANRNFTITGQCGIPSGASAVSFNFGALNVGAAGDLRVFPTGGGLPLVSTMNYNGNTPNIANAAVVPLGTGGAITVRADAVSIDLIIDVNGYYASTPATPTDYFSVINSGALRDLRRDEQSRSVCRGSVRKSDGRSRSRRFWRELEHDGWDGGSLRPRHCLGRNQCGRCRVKPTVRPMAPLASSGLARATTGVTCWRQGTHQEYDR